LAESKYINYLYKFAIYNIQGSNLFNKEYNFLLLRVQVRMMGFIEQWSLKRSQTYIKESRNNTSLKKPHCVSPSIPNDYVYFSGEPLILESRNSSCSSSYL